MKKYLIGALLIGVVVFGGFKVWHSSGVQSWLDDREKSALPVPEMLAESIAGPAVNADTNRIETIENFENTNTSVSSNKNESPETEVDGPLEKNLAVPFTSQAPHAKWDTDHGEFCEEASVLMVGRYFRREGISGPDDAEEALQNIKQWEIDNLGWYFDTTAAEVKTTLEGLYQLKVELVENPTIENIKTAVASGKLVIAPFAGRELGNPYYTAPGPVYHMLVIRGYTKDGKFITNDPGTKRGEEYVFKQATIMNAMHDWVPKLPRTTPANGSATGRKVILVVSRT